MLDSKTYPFPFTESDEVDERKYDRDDDHLDEVDDLEPWDNPPYHCSGPILIDDGVDYNEIMGGFN